MSSSGSKSIFQHYGPGGFGWALVQLNHNGYLSDEDLALVLEANPGDPLPEPIQNYLVKRLRGQAPKKRGPKPNTEDELFRIKFMMAEFAYNRAHRIARFLAANRKRIAKLRRERLPQTRTPPHELALSYVVKHSGWMTGVEPRNLHNLLSKANQARNRS